MFTVYSKFIAEWLVTYTETGLMLRHPLFPGIKCEDVAGGQYMAIHHVIDSDSVFVEVVGNLHELMDLRPIPGQITLLISTDTVHPYRVKHGPRIGVRVHRDDRHMLEKREHMLEVIEARQMLEAA